MTHQVELPETKCQERPAHGLLAETRRQLRLRHYSLRTEKIYLGWIRRFILVHGRRHPRELGWPDIECFLSTLSQEGRLAGCRHNQVLSSLLFLYRQVLRVQLPWMEHMVLAKRAGTSRLVERGG